MWRDFWGLDALGLNDAMEKELTIYDEATFIVDGKECQGMSCMGTNILDYINHKTSQTKANHGLSQTKA